MSSILDLGNERDLLSTDRKLRAEADALLESRGLRKVLEQYAPIHVVGSYALELMVWRDLDVLMEAPGISVDEFFDLGRRIATSLFPWKMFFTNSRDHDGAPHPRGLYWGIRLGDIKAGAWKIDLWAFEPEQSREKILECEHLKARVNQQDRLTILRLKSQLWHDARYRDQVTSQDIYDAVLEHGTRSLADFWTYVGSKQTQ
jgi:hypothetical protein